MAHSDIEPLNVSPVNDGPGAQGLGADRLADALRPITVASQSIGVGAASVQAKDEAARRFYRRCAAFEDYPAESRTLHLPIKTVVATFGKGGVEGARSLEFETLAGKPRPKASRPS